METSKNFKRLSDVEVVETPTETANVLIEEGGIIKKTPKTAVGGAGGTEEIVDLTVKINSVPHGTFTADEITIIEGSIDNVFTAFSENRVPNVKLDFFIEVENNYCYTSYKTNAGVYRYGTELYLSYVYASTYDGKIYNGFFRLTKDGVFETHKVYSTSSTLIN